MDDHDNAEEDGNETETGPGTGNVPSTAQTFTTRPPPTARIQGQLWLMVKQDAALLRQNPSDTKPDPATDW